MALSDNDRSIAAFTVVAHALVHWFELAVPILLVVWLAEFEVSMTLVGVVVALGYAPFGLGAVPAGLLVDRYRTKRLVVFCLAAMSLAFASLAVAPSIYTIAASLLIWGVAASIYHPAGLALISTGVEDRGTVFAWHGIAGNAGIALGPFVTATLLLFFEWRLVIVLLALPGVVATVYGLRARFDPTAALEDTVAADAARTNSPTAVVANSRSLFASSFLLVFLVVTLVGLFYRGTLTYLPEILHGLSTMADVSSPIDLEELSLGDYVYVWVLVAGMAGQYAGGKLTDHVPVPRGLVVIFVVLAALALVFVPVAGLGIVAIVLFCGVLGFALFAIEPFYQEAVAVYTPADTRGLSYGYTYLGMFGLGAASISAGGVLLEAFTLGVFFASLSAVAVVGAAVASLLVLNVGSHSSVSSSSPVSSDDD
ncbi:MFS transporter [Natrialbaceae archaeon AArc-T1-2]|uniref:MFS transporter n=1 Tax=Natrialbaceae archaeon AArc-T1-2 TaxID=3053904 RepID=UPI00255AA34D|nr:MFS transporter [Natrialbaceae archaeon AArc-T1-2]WIV66000.1 MFS transporter [Natrialbaceae archaeon AArc-T1-2]